MTFSPPQSTCCRRYRTGKLVPRHIPNIRWHLSQRHSRLRSLSLDRPAGSALSSMSACATAKPHHKLRQLRQQVCEVPSQQLEPIQGKKCYNSPDNVLMSFNPVLNCTSHHQLLFLRQPVRIASIWIAIEVLECRWRTVLCTPIRFGIVDCTDVQVVVGVLLVLCEPKKSLFRFIFRNN